MSNDLDVQQLNEPSPVRLRRVKLVKRASLSRKSLGNLDLTPVTNHQNNGNLATLVDQSPSVGNFVLKSLDEINSKGFRRSQAFNYGFIDDMNTLLRPGRINFRIAASSLDAGTRLYGSKVELVYDGTHKISTTLTMATGAEEQDSIDTSLFDTSRAEKTRHSYRPKTKKRKKKKADLIITNTESLNGKIETNLRIDPLLHHFSSFDVVGNVNSLLLANLIPDPQSSIVMDSDSSIDFEHIMMPDRQEILFNFANPDVIFTKDGHFGKLFHNFDFAQRDVNFNFGSQALLPPSQTQSFPVFNFDLGAPVADIDERPECDLGDYFNVSMEPGKETTAGETVDSNNNLLEMLPSDLQENQFFNPEYLRSNFRHMWRYRGVTNKSKVKLRSRCRKVREPYKEFQLQLDIPDDMFQVGEVEVSQKTKDVWVKRAEEQRVEENHGFRLGDLQSFFCLDGYRGTVSEKFTTPDGTQSQVDDFRPSEPLALESMMGVEDDLEAGTVLDFGVTEDLVEPLEIDYTTDSKRVDMRRLKADMFSLVKQHSDPNTTLTFSTMCHRLSTPNPDLTAATSFVALLHLCNDKSLHLEPNHHTGDFRILT